MSGWTALLGLAALLLTLTACTGLLLLWQMLRQQAPHRRLLGSFDDIDRELAEVLRRLTELIVDLGRSRPRGELIGLGFRIELDGHDWRTRVGEWLAVQLAPMRSGMTDTRTRQIFVYQIGLLLYGLRNNPMMGRRDRKRIDDLLLWFESADLTDLRVFVPRPDDLYNPAVHRSRLPLDGAYARRVIERAYGFYVDSPDEDRRYRAPVDVGGHA